MGGGSGKPEYTGFEIKERGGNLVVVFEYQVGTMTLSANEDGSTVFTDRRETVFDEKSLIRRVDLLKQCSEDAAIEERALGELRRARFARDLAAKRNSEPRPERDGGEQDGGGESEEDWIFGKKTGD